MIIRIFGCLVLSTEEQESGGKGAGVGRGEGGGVGAGGGVGEVGLSPLVQLPFCCPLVPFFRLHTPVPWFIVHHMQ